MSDLFGGGESSSGNNPLSSNLYEDEEHPWGAPPPPPPAAALGSTTTNTNTSTTAGGFGAGAETQSSSDLTDREALMGGFGNPSSNAYSNDLDAGFASDPYIASPFARQSSYNNGNSGEPGAGRGNASIGSSSRTAEHDDLFGRQGRDEGLSSSGYNENGNRSASSNFYGSEDQHGFGSAASNGFNSPQAPPRSAPAFGQQGSSAGQGYDKPVPQPSSAFNQRTFQSHNPSSVMPNSGPLGGHSGQDGYGAQSNGPAQLTPGYPMPQSYSTPTNYSPFARVENTRKESVEDMYGVPENFLEVEVRNPMTHGEYQEQR